MSVAMSGSVNTSAVPRWESVLGQLIFVTECPETPNRFTGSDE